MNKPELEKTSEYHKDIDKSEEFPIQKHINFWDKRNKGYLTPLDCILGFTELGYHVVFSVIAGTIVGVLLSLLSQKKLLIHPLFHSNVKYIARVKRRTMSNRGAYDENGEFILEQFESLFDKYARSDNTCKTITLKELIMMTQEQENATTWYQGASEVALLYVFIGNNGVFTKADIQSAYDGTMFYHMKRKLKYNKNSETEKEQSPVLAPYLAKTNNYSVRGLITKTIQITEERSVMILQKAGIDHWVSYVRDHATSLKDIAVPRFFSPSSMITGVVAPNCRSIKPADGGIASIDHLFPNGLTGISKESCEIIRDSPSNDIASSSEWMEVGSSDRRPRNKGEPYNIKERNGSSSKLVNHPVETVMGIPDASVPTVIAPTYKRENDNNWVSKLLDSVQTPDVEEKVGNVEPVYISDKEKDVSEEDTMEQDALNEQPSIKHEIPLVTPPPENEVTLTSTLSSSTSETKKVPNSAPKRKNKKNKRNDSNTASTVDLVAEPQAV